MISLRKWESCSGEMPDWPLPRLRTDEDRLEKWMAKGQIAVLDDCSRWSGNLFGRDWLVRVGECCFFVPIEQKRLLPLLRLEKQCFRINVQGEDRAAGPDRTRQTRV